MTAFPSAPSLASEQARGPEAFRRGAAASIALLLEQGAELHPLPNVLVRKPRHLGADVGRPDDEAEPLELDEGLANRGLAHVQIAGEVQLAQRIAGFEASGKDGVLQQAGDLEAERARFQRCESGERGHEGVVIVIDNRAVGQLEQATFGTVARTRTSG